MSTTVFLFALLTTVLWAGLLIILLLARRKEGKGQEQTKESKDTKLKKPSAKTEAEHARTKQILDSDPMLAKQLLKRAKLKEDVHIDDQVLSTIESRVPERLLRMLHKAATQKEIEFDLSKQITREPCGYPTNDIEPGPMRGFEQLPDVLPEQFMQEDDQFYMALAQEQLLVMQSHQSQAEQKHLMVLVDFSNSMFDHRMKDGLRRTDWSRSIAINLAVHALKSEANYQFRGFAGLPYKKLYTVSNAEEAAALTDWLLDYDSRGNGTDIWGVIQKGVDDLRAHKTPSEKADILLITDGEEERTSGYSVKNADALKDLLGTDIRLHVASIGLKSPWAQAVAVSYQEFK